MDELKHFLHHIVAMGEKLECELNNGELDSTDFHRGRLNMLGELDNYICLYLSDMDY